MELNRQSLLMLVAAAALVFTVAPERAEAGLFCGSKCKAAKALKRQQQAQQQAQAYPQQYPQQYPQAQPYPQPYRPAQPYAQPQPYGPTYDQREAAYQADLARRQQAYAQAQANAAAGQGYQQQYQPQYGQPQYQQPQYQQPYNSPYNGRVDYTKDGDQLEQNPNYLQFASPGYGTVATPLMGASFDKTPYPANVNEPELATLIAAAIAESSGDIEIGMATVNAALVKKFYAVRGNQPAFVTSQGPSQQAANLRSFFSSGVSLKGLDPRDYWSSDMETRFAAGAAATPYQKIGLDLLMAQSFVRVAGDLANGRANPSLIDTHTMVTKRTFNDFQALNNLLRGDAVSGLDSFEPQHPEYKALVEYLPTLLDQKRRGGWAHIPGLKVLNLGVSSSDVPLVRERLVQLGVMPNTGFKDPSLVYDQTLFAGVKAFQANHKLKPDGILGNQGFGILNIPLDERINQVRATLEKWRWLPRQLGDRYIIVNIARQEMKVVEFGRVVMQMNTINGKLLRPTNILVDKIDKVDINPFWNPPPNNILADIMPQQRKDARHMTDERVTIIGQGAAVRTVGGGQTVFAKGQVVDPQQVDWKQYINSIPSLQFREEPGPKNSLGVVKFSTTNSASIYLHDTNVRPKFQENERLFSSGCIRLQHPFQLLQYLLRDQPQYDATKLDEMMSQPTVYPHTEVKLTKEIPLYVTYQTISFGDQGEPRFTLDYYGQDSRIMHAITPAKDETF